MTEHDHVGEPDNTAVRTALWRALHLEVDPPPHVLHDDIGLRLAGPPEGWRERGDMHPMGTRPFRASIVARARFVEDMVAEQATRGVGQYVILGAGLDTYVQRHPEMSATLQVFEVDQPATQNWKRERLMELGLGAPPWLHLVPVDFEAGQSWRTQITAAGFEAGAPTTVACTGVSMYLTRDAIAEMLGQAAALAPGSKFVMTFLLPIELVDEQDRPGLEMSMKGAQSSGTPFISFFAPDEMLPLAREAGFKEVRHVAGTALNALYYAGRADGMSASSGEDFLVATT